MKTKKERAKIIAGLFDELRKDIVVKSEFQLRSLELYEGMEKRPINENSDEAVGRIRKMIKERTRKIYKIKATGKKYVVENGEIVKVTPLK